MIDRIRISEGIISNYKGSINDDVMMCEIAEEYLIPWTWWGILRHNALVTIRTVAWECFSVCFSFSVISTVIVLLAIWSGSSWDVVWMKISGTCTMECF